jgi:hypothetical protein
MTQQQIKKIKGITIEEINEIFGKDNIETIREQEGRPWIWIYFNKDLLSISGEKLRKLNQKGFMIDYISFERKVITIDTIRGF